MEEIDGLPPKIERDAELKGHIAGLREAAEIVGNVRRSNRDNWPAHHAAATIEAELARRISSLSPEGE